MSKVFEIPSSMGDFWALSEKCVEKEDFSGAVLYLRAALKYAKRDRDKKKILVELAKMYSARFKYGYSNELIYRLMFENPDDKELKIMMLINYLSLNDRELATYYYDQVKEFIKEKKVFAPHIVDDMIKLEVDLTGQNLDIDDSIDFNLDEILKDPPYGNTFTVVDDSVKFDQYVDKIVEDVNTGSYGEAIDLVNEALKLKINNQQKKVAIYSKAMSLLILGYTREAKELCENSLKEFGEDTNLRLLLCQTLVDIKDKKRLKEAIEPIINSTSNEIMQFHRITQILVKGELYDEAKLYLKKRILENPDSFSFNAYLGIVYFNTGDKEKARSIFSELNGRYGDLSTAKHFLNYIDANNKKAIPVEAVHGDWKELTTQYVNDMYTYLDLNDADFKRCLKSNYEDIIYKIKWLSTGMRAKPAFAMISRILSLNIYEETAASSKKIQNAKMELLKLCSTVPFFDKYTQIHIISEAIHAGVEESIPVLVDGRFFIANVSRLYDLEFSSVFADAFANALAISMCMGESEFNKVNKFMELFRAQLYTHNFKWRNPGTIVAFIIETALDVDVKDLDIAIEYGERQLENYKADYHDNQLVE